jgi:hypothetical protein
MGAVWRQLRPAEPKGAQQAYAVDAGLPKKTARNVLAADESHCQHRPTWPAPSLGRHAVSMDFAERLGLHTIRASDGECKINGFRPIIEGDITAVGKVVTQTRRTAYAETALHDDEGRLIARATGPFFLTETRAQKERGRIWRGIASRCPLYSMTFLRIWLAKLSMSASVPIGSTFWCFMFMKRRAMMAENRKAPKSS